MTNLTFVMYFVAWFNPNHKESNLTNLEVFYGAQYDQVEVRWYYRFILAFWYE
jgi:hypothetical protein